MPPPLHLLVLSSGQGEKKAWSNGWLVTYIEQTRGAASAKKAKMEDDDAEANSQVVPDNEGRGCKGHQTRGAASAKKAKMEETN